MDELRQQRLAHNEAKYRRINEHVTESVDQFRGGMLLTDEYSILCECAIEDCVSMIDVAAPEYERVRQHSSWFFIVPDHVIPELERPVEHHDNYWIIEKLGAGKLVAERMDPRR